MKVYAWNGEQMEYQDFVVGIAAPGDWNILAAMGMCGEAGEYSELVKKETFNGTPQDPEKKLKELGDVLWYLTLAAHLGGWTLEDVVQANTDKLIARFPNGYEHGGGRR